MRRVKREPGQVRKEAALSVLFPGDMGALGWSWRFGRRQDGALEGGGTGCGAPRRRHQAAGTRP